MEKKILHIKCFATYISQQLAKSVQVRCLVVNIPFIRNTEIGGMKLNGGGWKSSVTVFSGPNTQLNLEGTQTQVPWKSNQSFLLQQR